MAMLNQLHTNHSLPGALLIGLLATAALASPAPPPPPLLVSQPFGAVGFADKDGGKLVLVENGEYFEGRIALKVINNVPLTIAATVSPIDNSGLPNMWSVRLNEPGENQAFQLNTTSNKILTPHEPGAAGDLELRVRIKGVRHRWHGGHHAFTDVPAARITVTIMPNP